MPVRLSQIAELAGVSISTVSRVLNDKPVVNAETRRLVLEASDVLGYDRPVRLRVREGGLVGLVVPELDNPFFARFARAVEHTLSRAGHVTVICSHTVGGTHEDEYVRMLLEQGVAGIVFASGIHAVSGTDVERYRRLTRGGVPVVLVNGPLEGSGAAAVSTDDAVTMELAVRHLAHMGHRRIGLALGQGRYTTVARKQAAFVAAMRAHVGADLSPSALETLVAHTMYSLEGGSLAAARLLDAGATAVVCASDVMALGAVQAARRRGVEVPRDLSVVGIDDSALMALTDPPLTTVRQPVEALAAAGCHALLDQVGGAPAPPGEQLFAPELVVRGSTGPAR